MRIGMSFRLTATGRRAEALPSVRSAKSFLPLRRPQYRELIALPGRAEWPPSRIRLSFAELLIDCEEDRTLRAVLVGMALGGAATELAESASA